MDAEQEISAEEKQDLEKTAVEKYSKELGNNLDELWREYDERSSEEARFVKDMDLIDMCLQALKYEKQRRYNPEEENENFQKYENMDEFFATTEPRLNTKTGEKLFHKVESRYEEAKESKSA